MNRRRRRAVPVERSPSGRGLAHRHKGRARDASAVLRHPWAARPRMTAPVRAAGSCVGPDPLAVSTGRSSRSPGQISRSHVIDRHAWPIRKRPGPIRFAWRHRTRRAFVFVGLFCRGRARECQACGMSIQSQGVPCVPKPARNVSGGSRLELDRIADLTDRIPRSKASFH